MTCFRDDSIHGWEADTLEYKYHLPVPEGEKPNFRVFAVSQDGHYFAAGGRCVHAHTHTCMCVCVRVCVCPCARVCVMLYRCRN